MKLQTAFSALILLVVFTLNANAQWKVEKTDQGISISEGPQKVFFYQRKMKSQGGRYGRANYLHPLYDLDGQVLTEDFPKDHPHHRGIFWAWHQLKIDGKQIGDPWATVDTTWTVRNARTRATRDGKLVLATVTDVSSKHYQGGKPYITERVWVQVHPASNGTRVIDFDIHLHARVDKLKIGGSDNDKGYGGFSTRIRLPKGLTFRGQKGKATPIRTAVKAGPWMDISGAYGKGGSKAGISILVHPSSPGFPQGWILRTGRSMQNPAYPGQHPVAIPIDKPMKLRYRLVLHRGAPSASTINQWQEEFASTGPIAGDRTSRPARRISRLRQRIRRLLGR